MHVKNQIDLDLVPDPVVARQLGVTLMTIWRWSHDDKLGFPKRIKIRTRNYRSLRELTAWRNRMARQGTKAGKAVAS